MAKETGLFMNKYLQDVKLQLYIGEQVDWFHYADNDSMSHALVVGVFKAYDAETGIITFQSESGHEFWVAEEKIEIFWRDDSDFSLNNATTSTIRSGRLRTKNRDIMRTGGKTKIK